MAPGQGLHGLITVYDELTHKQPLGEGFTLGVHWAKLNHCKTSSADSNEAHQMRLKRLSVQYERANLNLVVPGWHNSKKNDDDDDGLIWQFEDVLDERLRQLRKDPQDKDSGPYFMIGLAGGLSFGGGSEDTVRRSVARINTTFPSADVQDEALAKAIFRLPAQQLTSDDYLDSLKKLLLSRANERVLFISACPRGEILIRTDTEYRDIKKRIDQSTHRSSVKLALELSSSVKAMSNALRKHKPTILHFSGHARADGLCFEDENGNLDLIQTGSLTELMRQGRKFGLHTVILNACYTADQSDCIARIVGRVVAMPGVIKDEEAIMFSEGFYDSIGEGYGPDEAFDWGDAQLRTHNVPLERHPLIKHRAGLRAEATVPALPEPDNAFESESESEFEPAPGSNSHSEHARQTLSATKKTAQRKGECKTPQAEKPNIPITMSSPSTDSMESDNACSTDDSSAPSTPTTEVDGRARATDVKKTEPQSSARPEPAQGLSMIEFLKLRSKIDSQKTSNNTAPKPRPAANTARPAPNGAPNANPAPDRPSAFQPTCNSKPQTACPSHRPATGTPSGRTTCDPKMANLPSSCHPRSSYYPCDSFSSCDDKLFAFLLSEVLTAQPSASTRAGPSRSRMRLRDCDCCGNVLPLEEGGYVCETCSNDRKQMLACVRCAGRLLCRFAGHKVVRVRYQT